MSVSGFLMQTGLPRGPSGLSYFCFYSPVLSPGDRDRNQLRSLPAWRSSWSGVGELPAVVRLSLPEGSHWVSSLWGWGCRGPGAWL